MNRLRKQRVIQVDFCSFTSFSLPTLLLSPSNKLQSISIMSSVSTPNESPAHAEPLHNPARAAKVVVPQAPLGNASSAKLNSQQPGMGAKALLAKKMAKSRYVLPQRTYVHYRPHIRSQQSQIRLSHRQHVDALLSENLCCKEEAL